MARRVFFSFHYENDINRSMTVRNSWVTQGKEAAGFVDKAEFEQIKRHASEGGRVVREVLSGVTDEEYVALASDIAAYHHERWDGTGYPTGLKGEAIPLCARIMAFADVYDALISERCYKKAMSKENAFEIIRQEAGTHFDPKLAEVFLHHREAF